jgi:hypothetical protein
MSTPITYLAAQEHARDLRREAQSANQLSEVQNNPDQVKVRRVAVIRPAGSHFALVPTRRLVDARGR